MKNNAHTAHRLLNYIIIVNQIIIKQCTHQNKTPTKSLVLKPPPVLKSANTPGINFDRYSLTKEASDYKIYNTPHSDTVHYFDAADRRQYCNNVSI